MVRSAQQAPRYRFPEDLKARLFQRCHSLSDLAAQMNQVVPYRLSTLWYPAPLAPLDPMDLLVPPNQAVQLYQTRQLAQESTVWPVLLEDLLVPLARPDLRDLEARLGL